MSNFNSAYSTAFLMYGVEIPPEDFEEIGLIAWNMIGNKKSRLYRYCAKVQCPDYTLRLPCNADIIEAVTYNYEDWNYSTNLTVNGDYNSQFTENYIETRKLYSDPLYVSGKYAKFEQVDDVLYFDRDYGQVTVLYKGVILDEEGLPDINEKEALAIATYVAFVKKQRDGWITNNSSILEAAQYMYQQWLKYCDSARVPVSFSQNDMNEILDAKSNWNRKIFNKSYKPVK